MFKFRLQRVLELRAEAEQAKARVLATAQEAADVARRAQERMQARVQELDIEVHEDEFDYWRPFDKQREKKRKP